MRRLLLDLRQALTPMAKSRAAVVHWQNTALSVARALPTRLRAALGAAAAFRRRSQQLAAEKLQQETRPRLRLRALASGLRQAAHRHLVLETGSCLRALARARSRIRCLVDAMRRGGSRVALQRIRRFAQLRQLRQIAVERRQVELRSDKAAGARALGSQLAALGRSRQRQAFARLEEAVRYKPLARPPAAHMAKALGRLLRRRALSGLSAWRRATLSAGGRGALAERAQAIADLCAMRRLTRRLRKVLGAWRAMARGPRCLARSLSKALASRLSFSFSKLRIRAAENSRARLAIRVVEKELRRRRKVMLSGCFEAWRVRFCRAERLHRRQLVALERRLGLRYCRTALKSLEVFALQMHSVRRLAALFQRVLTKSGLKSWHRRSLLASAGASGREVAEASGQRALGKQKADFERFLEQRARESAERTAKVLLHAWRCGSAAEKANQAQRLGAARGLLLLLSGLARSRRRAALERWRAISLCCRSATTLDQRTAARDQVDKLERVRQGGLILQATARHRQRMALCRALNGSWRTAKWQSVVRSLDASAAREQRRLRADGEALRAQLDEERHLAHQLRTSEVLEAERNDLALEETNAILRDVHREREYQAQTVDRVRAELRREVESEAEALRRANQSVTAEAAEAATLRGVLWEARSQAASLESDHRAAVKELGVLRTELREARQTVEKQAQAELQREREALVWNIQVHDAERDARERAARTERETEDRLERRIEDHTRQSELQASMAEDQERNIRHLEDLVKEQGHQLRQERRERSKSVDQLRNSASITESKSLLLQEQVTALRQQLQREQAELRASERAWAGDRVALLSAVVKPLSHLDAADEYVDDGPHMRASSQRGRRRMPRASTSPLRTSSRIRSIGGRGNCPWHGSGKAARILGMEGAG